MKNKTIRSNLLASCLLSLLLLFVTSCRKEILPEPGDETGETTAPEAATDATAMIEANDEAATFRMSPSAPLDSGTCPNISWSEQMGIYPNTLTIDFGEEGCKGRHGHHFSGAITVTVTGSHFEPGTIRVVYTDNFRVNGTCYFFEHRVTNEGNDNEGRMYWSIVTDLTRVKGNRGHQHDECRGNTTTWHADRLRTLVGGTDTEDDVTDNMYEITGTASGTRPNGRAFESVITTPLVKIADCPWVVSGVEVITVEGRDGAHTLDYGDGGCDNKATLTLPNGETEEIKIPEFFRPWWRR
jgi:hypothetical protein